MPPRRAQNNSCFSAALLHAVFSLPSLVTPLLLATQAGIVPLLREFGEATLGFAERPSSVAHRKVLQWLAVNDQLGEGCAHASSLSSLLYFKPHA